MVPTPILISSRYTYKLLHTNMQDTPTYTRTRKVILVEASPEPLFTHYLHYHRHSVYKRPVPVPLVLLSSANHSLLSVVLGSLTSFPQFSHPGRNSPFPLCTAPTEFLAVLSQAPHCRSLPSCLLPSSPSVRPLGLRSVSLDATPLHSCPAYSTPAVPRCEACRRALLPPLSSCCRLPLRPQLLLPSRPLPFSSYGG